jgi:hypothetical protein
MRFDAQGLQIERLALRDFGGAALAIKGSINTRATAPRGALNFELDARKLDGIAALIEKLSPQAAAELRRNAAQMAPATLTASLTVGAASEDAALSVGRFGIDGHAGGFRLGLHGDFGTLSKAFTVNDLSQLRSAAVSLTGRIEADDGRSLVSLFGLGHLLAVDEGAGRLELAIRGPLDGDMALSARIAAGGLDVAGKGRLRLSGNEGPTAGFDIKVAAASLRTSYRAALGMPTGNLPVTLAAQMSLADNAVNLSALTGKLAGTEVSGRLRIGLTQPVSVRGEMSLGTVNLPAAIGTAIGVPPSASGARGWPAEPFEPGVWADIVGEVALRLGKVALTPGLSASDVRAVLHVDRGMLTIEQIDGSLAGGRVAGRLTFRSSDGLAVDSHLRIAGAKVDELLPGDGALAGLATIELDLRGAGRSPIALIGGLKGKGSFTLQDGRIARLDPAAFEAVTRSVDQGLPVDIARIGERLEATLGAGALTVPLAQGELIAVAGQLRLANTAVRANGANLAVTGSFDIAENTIDARLALSGPALAGVPGDIRPEAMLSLRGPLAEPRRSLDVASFTNLLALRAIEEKAKRIDELQAGREVRVPSASAAPAGPSTPAVAPSTAVPKQQGGPPAARATPAPVVRPPQQKTPATRPPSAQAPIDIRPVPAARPQSNPQSNTARSENQPRSAPPPRAPDTRSWLERLLNP